MSADPDVLDPEDWDALHEGESKCASTCSRPTCIEVVDDPRDGLAALLTLIRVLADRCRRRR